MLVRYSNAQTELFVRETAQNCFDLVPNDEADFFDVDAFRMWVKDDDDFMNAFQYTKSISVLLKTYEYAACMTKANFMVGTTPAVLLENTLHNWSYKEANEAAEGADQDANQDADQDANQNADDGSANQDADEGSADEDADEEALREQEEDTDQKAFVALTIRQHAKVHWAEKHGYVVVFCRDPQRKALYTSLGFHKPTKKFCKTVIALLDERMKAVLNGGTYSAIANHMLVFQGNPELNDNICQASALHRQTDDVRSATLEGEWLSRRDFFYELAS